MSLDVEAVQRAAALHGEGRLDDARQALEILLQGPGADVPVVHYLMALVLLDLEDQAGALRCFDAMLALGAVNSAEIHFRRAGCLRALGRLEEAAQSYRRGLTLEPGNFEAWSQLGVTLAALGQLEEAICAYDAAISLIPTEPRTHNNRGAALESLGRPDEALKAYETAVGLDPSYAVAWHNRGAALLRLHQNAAALHCFDKATEHNPHLVESLNQAGVALMRMERFDEALRAFEQAVAQRPGFPEAHSNRSVALRRLGRYEEALDAADIALALDPVSVEALDSRGSALSMLCRFEEALLTYDQAISLRPAHAPAWLNRGVALEALEQFDASRAAFERAEALDPIPPDPGFNMAMLALRRGDFAEGFARYEIRWKQKNGPRPRHPQVPLWLGEQALEGKTFLAHAEQGLGDIIQFARFVPQIAAHGARVIFEVEPALLPLMRTLGGDIELRPRDGPLPAFDLQAPLMSLPLGLKTTVADLAPAGPYLSADASRLDAWRQYLGERKGLRIGIAWSGNPKHQNDHNRSLSFEAVRPLLQLPFDWISLQREHRPEDLTGLEALGSVRIVSDQLESFADTAALIAACDLVIAVDTSVAHLAGALGKPVWILLPRYCDWRWMSGRDDSPWYASARLFRQTRFASWREPVEAVGAALAKF